MEERGHDRRGDLEGGVGLSEKSVEGIINIGGKPVVERRATARGRVVLQAATKAAIESGAIAKGDVLEASTVAVLQAVKDTPRIIPHCHPIPLEGTEVDWGWEGTSLWCTVKSLEKDAEGQYPAARITDLEVVEKFKGT